MRKRLPWITAGLIIMVVFSIMYGTAQQLLRIGANDPQIQLAEDTAASLQAGQTPASLVNGHVDITKSLAPFIIVYDKSGRIIAGNGFQDGQVPRIPLGVLNQVNKQGYNAVTWQLSQGERFAAVAVPAGNYRVVSARSLREVELRENQVEITVGTGWFLSLILLILTYFICKWLDKGGHRHSPFSIKSITGILKSKE